MRATFPGDQAFGSEQSLMRCVKTAQCQMIAEFEPARWYYHYAFPSSALMGACW